jgi:hypothetical protein
MLARIIEAPAEARFAIMDTMEDTILNLTGALVMYIALKIRPYRHRGNNNINKIIEAELAKNAKEKTEI